MDQHSSNERRTGIRQEMRERRANLSQETLTTAEQLLSKNIQAIRDDWAKIPRKVAGYLAINGEISLDQSLKFLRTSGNLTCVPVIVKDTMRFAPLGESTVLHKGKYGILIPEFNESELLEATELDVVLVPLVAFDSSGNRIGMGGGYYDRTFAHLKDKNQHPKSAPLFIGVGYEFQRLNTVPAESWDVPLHMAATDRNIYSFD